MDIDISNVRDVFMATICCYVQQLLIFPRNNDSCEQIRAIYAYRGAVEHVVEICLECKWDLTRYATSINICGSPFNLEENVGNE